MNILVEVILLFAEVTSAVTGIHSSHLVGPHDYSDGLPTPAPTATFVPTPTATTRPTPTATRLAATATQRVPATATTAPRPSVPAPPSGDAIAAHLRRIRQCESDGNYRAESDVKDANGVSLYWGAYQFSIATWYSVGGSGNPAHASPQEQDLRARILYERSGPGQWPHCQYAP